MLSSTLTLGSITCAALSLLSFYPAVGIHRSLFLVHQVGRSWSSKGRSLVISRARAHARPIATIGVVNPPPSNRSTLHHRHLHFYLLHHHLLLHLANLQPSSSTFSSSFTFSTSTSLRRTMHDLSATTCRPSFKGVACALKPRFTGSWISGETWTDKRKYGDTARRKIRIVQQVLVRVDRFSGFWIMTLASLGCCLPLWSLDTSFIDEIVI